MLKFKHPISGGYSSLGFMSKNNQIYAIKNCKYIKEENYANLFLIENFSTIDDIGTFNYVEGNLDDYIIGLPYVSNGNNNEKLYTFISKTGKELQKNQSLQYSQL